MVTRRQCHSDHCRPAKHHVDADQQSKRPGRRSRQAGKDNPRQNEVDNAVLIAFFIVEGIATLMYAIDHRAQLSGGWGWMLASA